MIAVLLSLTAVASGLSFRADVPGPIAGHAVFELRAGVNGVAQREGPMRPYLCAEASPLRRLSVEACGNGSGVLHQAEGPDVAHFRLRGAPLVHETGRLRAMMMVGVGITEVQSTADRPGFKFGSANEAQVEAAGPEASVGFKGRYWMTRQSHVSVDVVAGTAYIPGAPAVMGWASPVVPFVSLTTGMGF